MLDIEFYNILVENLKHPLAGRFHKRKHLSPAVHFKCASSGVHVDGDDDGLLDGVANLAGEFVGSAHAFLQGDVFVGFYVGYTFDFKVQVFNQWSGGLDNFFAPVVSQLIQHQFQPGLPYRLYRCIGRQGHCIGGLYNDACYGNIYRSTLEEFLKR